MRDVKIYPLRLTKKSWRIPIHVRHQCSDHCSKIFVRNPNNRSENGLYNFDLQDNPEYKNGKCPKFNKIDIGMLNLASFSYKHPHGIFGPLYNPNEVVIPDQKIWVEINYPILNPISVSMDFSHPNITRLELLYAISIIYRSIYLLEEVTSPPIQYTIIRDCDNCFDKTAYDYVIMIHPKEREEKKEDQCIICYQNYTDKVVKLPCNHNFHDICIKKWLTDHNTCPLCRTNVLNCHDCDGKRCVIEDHESVVIPIEHRGNILNRNTTFGFFGIYGYDFDDLCLQEMKYDRINKKLDLIFSP